MITNNKAIQIINDLTTIPDNLLSSWEVDFIYAMEDKIEFTDKELLKIEELAEKHL